MRPFPPKLNEVYEHHYQSHSQPHFQELQDIFLATVQQFKNMILKMHFYGSLSQQLMNSDTELYVQVQIYHTMYL